MRLTCISVALLLAAPLAQGGPPTVLSLPGHKAMAPELAIAPDGSIAIVWVERTPRGEDIAAAGAASKEGHTHLAETDLWFSRSTDGGKTFTTPVQVNREVGAVWGFPISKPRVAIAGDGTVHVFYPGNAIDSRTGKPIVLPMYTRSTDGGKTFGAARLLGTVPSSDNSDVVKDLANAECFGTMTTDDKGGVFAYWIDTRDMSKDEPDGKIFSAVSLDNGVSFGKDFEVFPADACPCCQITATTHAGRIYMGSRQVSADGNRDSVVAVSSDRGKTFAPRVRWGGAHWKIEACPLKPTALAIDGSFVYAAAYNGGADPQAAYFSRSTDGGRTFEPAIQLHPGAAVSDAPVLAVLNGRVIAAWHAKTGGDRRIHLGVSQDRGKTFAPPVEMPAPPGTGIYPVIAVRAGGIQLAWQQSDTIVTQYIAPDDPLLGSRATAAR